MDMRKAGLTLSLLLAAAASRAESDTNQGYYLYVALWPAQKTVLSCYSASIQNESAFKRSHLAGKGWGFDPEGCVVRDMDSKVIGSFEVLADRLQVETDAPALKAGFAKVKGSIGKKQRYPCETLDLLNKTLGLRVLTNLFNGSFDPRCAPPTGWGPHQCPRQALEPRIRSRVPGTDSSLFFPPDSEQELPRVPRVNGCVSFGENWGLYTIRRTEARPGGNTDIEKLFIYRL